MILYSVAVVILLACRGLTTNRLTPRSTSRRPRTQRPWIMHDGIDRGVRGHRWVCCREAMDDAWWDIIELWGATGGYMGLLWERNRLERWALCIGILTIKTIGIPIIKIWSHDFLTCIMGIPKLLIRLHLHIGMVPGRLCFNIKTIFSGMEFPLYSEEPWSL